MIAKHDGGRYIEGEYDTEQLALLEKAFDPTQEGIDVRDGCCGCEYIPEEVAVVLRHAGLKVVPISAVVLTAFNVAEES